MQRLLGIAIAFAILMTASVGGLIGTASAQTPTPANTITVTADPASGPSGTVTTITVTGGSPGDPVTLTMGPGTVAGVVGADGTYTFTTTIFGQVGDVVDIEAQVGISSDSPKGSTTFTITGDGLFEDRTGVTIGDRNETAAAANTIVVKVDPASGPSGTSATITVTGGNPGDAVTLTLDPGAVAGVVGADGTYSYTTTFFGQAGDVITVEAQVGSSSDSPKGSATFTVTGETALGTQLQIGGNLVTYGGNSLAVVDALGSIADIVESVSWFDAETQEWHHWTPAQENLPGALRQHVELTEGNVYWVVVSAAAQWVFPVVQPATTILASAPAGPPPPTRVTVLSDGTRVYDTDENGDGRADHRIVIRPDGSRVELRDTDRDGKFDTAVRFDANGLPVDRWIDANGDGRPQAGEVTALPIQTPVDSDNDGKIDRIDIDIDGDGRADVQVILDANGKPVRVLIFAPGDPQPVERVELDANGREKSRFIDHDHDGVDDRLQDPRFSDQFAQFDGEDPALGLFPSDEPAAAVCVTGGTSGVEFSDASNSACDAVAPPVAVLGPIVPAAPVAPPVEVDPELALELEGELG